MHSSTFMHALLLTSLKFICYTDVGNMADKDQKEWTLFRSGGPIVGQGQATVVPFERKGGDLVVGHLDIRSLVNKHNELGVS